MTAWMLLALISGAVLVQLAVGFGLSVWRFQPQGSLPSAAESGDPSTVNPRTETALRPFRVVRREFEDRAQTQCSFYLEPVDHIPLPAFEPGQYLIVSVDPAGRPSSPAGGLVRCYSLSDRPHPEVYRITVKRMPAPVAPPALPAGIVSAHFHDTVREGDIVQARGPFGSFTLGNDAGVPAVLIAGGIGVTPMMRMLLTSISDQPDRPIHLFYGVRNGVDHAFKATLEGLAGKHPNFHLTVLYATPGPDDRLGEDYQESGFVSIDVLKRALPHGRHRFYVCGPPAMMSSLLPALIAWGVPSADVHYESFGPASFGGIPLPPASGPHARSARAVDVRFGRSKRTLAWTGEDANLLDFAERHGVAVASGCRSGNCGGCETRLVSGEVIYAVRPDHDPAQGHCLLCVGTPGSALVLDA